MNLVIDIGNQRIKAGVFTNSVLTYDFTCNSIPELLEHVGSFEINHVIYSSVRDADETSIGLLKIKFNDCIILHSGLDLPINNKYHTPKTLGSDRLAVAVAAFDAFPHKNCLVIDAGTALTFEFINQDGEYLGGTISPGLKMRLHALHNNTSHLPLIGEINNDDTLYGTTTSSAISKGVVNGLIAELNNTIEQYNTTFDNLQVLLTGGDAKFFESTIKAPIFVDLNLVLKGLDRILRHHVS